MGVIPWARQFQNGDVAAKALMLDLDGGGNFLQPSAAVSFRQFAAEFRATFGVDLTVSEAFRDLPTQERYYDLYRRGIGNPAAVPGTSSHGQGLAVDINSWVYGNGSNTTRHNWLVDNAPRFGWSWELVGKPSGEPWHFNYVGGWSDWAGSYATPYETEEQREERELMAAKEELLKAIAELEGKLDAALRGNVTVYWNPETKRTYSVSPRLIKHHASTLEYQSALRQSGQESTRLAIQAGTEELKIVFYNSGLAEFAGKIEHHPEGFTFEPGAKITW